MEPISPQQHTVRDDVLAKIEKQEVLMRPKWSFGLQLAALSFLVFITFALSVFICNFIIFHLSESGRTALLGFGPEGYVSFLEFFPWGLLIIDIVFLFATHRLAKTFEFGYKRPGAYLIFGLALVILTSGAIVNGFTSFNTELRRQAEAGHLPSPIRDLYDQARRPPPSGRGVCRCEIVAISSETLTLKNPDDGTLFTVVLPPERFSKETFEVGETIFIAGKVQKDSVRAFGIKREDRRKEFEKERKEREELRTKGIETE